MGGQDGATAQNNTVSTTENCAPVAMYLNDISATTSAFIVSKYVQHYQETESSR